MNSPDVPYRNYVQIDRKSERPIFLQISDQIAAAIRDGYLANDLKLPGARQLAALLNVHRNTVSASYEELEAQGWITTIASSGSYVNRNHSTAFGEPNQLNPRDHFPKRTGFFFKRRPVLDSPFGQSRASLRIDDGLTDVRLSNVSEVARLFHTNMTRKSTLGKLSADNLSGNDYYRERLAEYLNQTRGLRISKENILVTRSSELGIYLAAESLINPGDRVAVGELGYFSANMILQKSGAQIRRVPINREGMDISALKKLCEQERIRMVYITPQHHYPTTVTLSRERRKAILELANEYGFVILEDDYDHDFHYGEGALLPLASMDNSGMVVYSGVFGRPLPSGFRSGFIVAPEELIQEMRKLYGIMDRHGDVLGALVLGELIADGEIHRYLKKANKEYQNRRDILMRLLITQFEGQIDFEVPEGGLALWTKWPTAVNLMAMSKYCAQNDLYLPPYLLYQSDSYCGIRLGYGSLTTHEIENTIDIMHRAYQSARKT